MEDFHSQLWTKDFKSSPPEEDDVEEDDVEMTGEDSGKVFRVDEDPFEIEMCLVNETSGEEVRVSYVNPKALDQLEEWMSGRHLSILVWVSVRAHSCQPRLPGRREDVETVPWLPCIWRRDRVSLLFTWKTT
jgi:hypothetical protein